MKLSSSLKSYANEIPRFLWDRPSAVVNHCMDRLNSADATPKSDVNHVKDRTYSVRGAKGSYVVYQDKPACEWVECRCCDLPWKHMFTLFNHTIDECFLSLPHAYLTSPSFRLDSHVMAQDIIPTTNRETMDALRIKPDASKQASQNGGSCMESAQCQQEFDSCCPIFAKAPNSLIQSGYTCWNNEENGRRSERHRAVC